MMETVCAPCLQLVVELISVVASSSISSSSLTLSSIDICSTEHVSFVTVDAWKSSVYRTLGFQWLGCGSEAPSMNL